MSANDRLMDIYESEDGLFQLRVLPDGVAVALEREPDEAPDSWGVVGRYTLVTDE